MAAETKPNLETTASHDTSRTNVGVIDPIEGNEKGFGGKELVDSASPAQYSEDGKLILTDKEAWEALGYHFPTWKKWTILSVIFIVQCSMNFNAGVYPNAVKLLEAHFGCSEFVARLGQMIFLITYAFGCELWAPWSEELGRWVVLQTSLLFVNIWQIPCIVAPNMTTIIVSRALGGLSSAGGSVTLGMVADMWDADDQQYAVAFIVFSSVGGSVLGPVIGGVAEQYLSWRWNFILQLIFGVSVQVLHFFLVPETRSSILIDREAQRRRKAGQDVWGPGEVDKHSLTLGEVLATWSRPFIMFATEPIVLCLSLLSGFSDALVFTFFVAWGPVFAQWDFSPVALGMAFWAVFIGYFIAYFSFFPIIKKQMAARKSGKNVKPEARLWWLLYTAPLEPLGLFGFAWTSLGPPRVHWIAPLIFSALVGIANLCIYMTTIDYMIASYGPYSASATGGNGFARDFLAGIAALYSKPLFENIGKSNQLEWASTLLACIASLVCIPVYVIYYYGPSIRARSKFAQTLAAEREDRGGLMPTVSRTISMDPVSRTMSRTVSRRR